MHWESQGAGIFHSLDGAIVDYGKQPIGPI